MGTLFGMPIEIILLWVFILWQQHQMNSLAKMSIKNDEQNRDLDERLKKVE